MESPERRGFIRTNGSKTVNLNEVANIFPHGRLMPMSVAVGSLTFHTANIDDLAVCDVACVSIGYESGK